MKAFRSYVNGLFFTRREAFLSGASFSCFSSLPRKINGEKVKSNETANEGRCILVVVFSHVLVFSSVFSKVGALMHCAMLSFVEYVYYFIRPCNIS